MSLVSMDARLGTQRNKETLSNTATAGSTQLPAAGTTQTTGSGKSFAQRYAELQAKRLAEGARGWAEQERTADKLTVEQLTVAQLTAMGPQMFFKTAQSLRDSITDRETELKSLEEQIRTGAENWQKGATQSGSRYYTILRNTGLSQLKEMQTQYQQKYQEYEQLLDKYNGYISAYDGFKGNYRRATAIEQEMKSIEEQVAQVKKAGTDDDPELETVAQQVEKVVNQYQIVKSGGNIDFDWQSIPYARDTPEWYAEYNRREKAAKQAVLDQYKAYEDKYGDLSGGVQGITGTLIAQAKEAGSAAVSELEKKLAGLKKEHEWTEYEDSTKWYKKYQGLSYDEIGQILMTDPTVSFEERRWALSYGDTIKTGADFDKQISYYTDKVADLEAEAEQIQKVIHQRQEVMSGGNIDFDWQSIPYARDTPEWYAEYNRRHNEAKQAVLDQYKAYEDKYGDLSGGIQGIAGVLNAQADQLTYQRDLRIRYGSLPQNEDFARESVYKPEPVESPDFAAYTQWEFPLYEAVNGNKTAKESLENRYSKIALPGNVGSQLVAGFLDLYNSVSEMEQMEQEEIRAFNYLYHTQGKAAAQEYYDFLRPALLSRQRKAQETAAAEYAQEHPVLSSVGKVLASPAKVFSYVGQLADYIGDGEVDKNAAYNRFVYESNATLEAVSQKIEQSGNWGKVGSFAYNTAMSMGEFLFTTAITGGNSALSLGIMGTGAAADTTLDALDRGLSSGQAMLLGTIAGATEILTEKISIDALLDKTGMGKTAVGYILQNMLAEGSEEGISGIANTLADIFISKDKSQWQQSIQAYKDAGNNEKTAFWKAVGDQALQIGLDVLGGTLSGAAMGSGSAAISAGGAAITGGKLKRGGTTSAKGPELIAAGLNGKRNGRAYYLATQMQAKLDAGEQLTSYDLGRLFQANKAEGLAMELTPGQLATIQEAIRQQILGQAEDDKNTAQAGGDVQLKDPQVNATKEMIQEARRLSAVTGRRIVLFTEAATENGIDDGYHENGVLYINTESENPLAVNVAHELTHSIEKTAEWGSLKQLVLDRIDRTPGRLEQERKAKRNLYKKNGVKLTDPDKVDREIVATYVARNLLSDMQSIEDVVRQNRDLGKKIHDWINNLLAKLGNKNAQEAVFLRKARDLYAAALRKTQSSFTQEAAQATPAAQNARANSNADFDSMTPGQVRQWALDAYAAGQISEETLDQIQESIDAQEDMEGREISPEAELKRIGMGDSAQHSISPTFTAEIDAWDGKAEKTFYVGSTSDALRSIGVKVTGIIWHSAKLSKIMKKHSAMTKEIIKQVPEILEHPVAVLASKQSDSRLVIFGTVTDANGDPVTAILELQPTTKGGQLLDMTVIASAYGKEGNVAKFVEGSGLVYLDPDRKRTESWMQGLGLQLPSDATAFGSIGSVSYPDGKVKIESIPYDQYMQEPEEDAVDGRQYSISEPTVDKADVISNLRAILNKGGDPVALRQYVARLEQNTGNAERNNGFAYHNSDIAERNNGFAYHNSDIAERNNGFAYHNSDIAERNDGFAYQKAETAQEILAAAREQKVSVEEYLEQNWEHYDVDGQWNAQAQEALDQEERASRRQYSISENNTLDNSLPKNENIFTTSQERGTLDDDRRIRKMPAAGSESTTGNRGQKSVPNDGGSYTEHFGDTQEVKEWGNLNSTVRKRIRKIIDSHIRESENADEIYGYIVYLTGKSESEITLESYNEAVNTLTEEIYTKAIGEHPIIFESKMSFLGEPSKLRNNVLRAVNVDTTSETAKSERQYSFSEPATEQATEGGAPETTISGEDVNQQSSDPETVNQQDAVTDEEIRNRLPRKAQRYLKRAERTLLNRLCQTLSVPYYARRNFLQPMVEEISNEYLRNGTVSEETIDRLFDKAYEEGVVVDREFYDENVDIKRFLRTNPVTLDPRNRVDIADYDDFRRRNRYTLRIKEEGGLPVDSAYRELQEMAPHLFPEDITHPADQLVRMADVANSIRIAEKSLEDYYKNDPDFKKWAKHDFAGAVDGIAAELWRVKRYHEDRLSENSELAPETPEEAEKVYAQIKEARRVYEKALAKNLLTEHDDIRLGRLIRGEIELQHLDPKTDNVAGITAVYEAKIEYADLLRQIVAYNSKRRAALREKADNLLRTANDWKDKRVGLAYMRETMTRNIEDIVPDPELAKQINAEYFEKVAVSEAEATRLKDDLRGRVRRLKLSRKVKKGNLVSEAHAVQLLGEAQDNIRMLEKSGGRIKVRDGKHLSEWKAVVDKLWEENPGLDKAKIQNAVQEFRRIYDELFRMMNTARIRNGYEPINYRSGYFPHFQPGDGDGVLAQFGKILGIDTKVEALPTTINGLTHIFKPGIQWFGNAQERLGFNTAYDAVEGFDKYIEGAASVICQTDNIQNLRAFASQVRYRTSEPGIQEQVDDVLMDDRLTEDEKQAKISQIYEHGKFALSNFVTELDEYTNLLANKKSRLDRTVEALLGRRVYAFMKDFESRVGANMVAGNISSAITNFIPLVQAAPRMDRGTLLRGMWETLKAYKTGDGLVEMSDFLTNRRGSDPLIRTWVQKGSNIVGKPMEFVDCFAADSIVRGAYYQNLKRGMTAEDAMHQADLFASRVMADRSKGAMPTLFSSMNPVLRIFTQFQLEVNNQFSEVFKDIPRGYREKGMAALVGVLFKYFLGSWLFNELFEALFGRRPALDPVGLLNDTAGDFFGYALPNTFEMAGDLIAGEEISFKTEKKHYGEAAKSLVSNTLSELPFASALTLFGAEIDGGRIPVSSAVPNLADIWGAISTPGWGSEKRMKEIGDELAKLMYVLPPFMGGQLLKSAKGIISAVSGGSYSVDSQGNPILQYPVYDDIGSIVRAMILGKNSLPEAQEWVDSGFDSLNAKQTAAFQDIVAIGEDPREIFAMMKDWKALQPLPGKTQVSDNQYRELLLKTEVSAEAKKIMVGMLMGTDLANREGKPTQYTKFLSAMETGMDVDEYLQFRNDGGNVDNYLELNVAGMTASEALKITLAVDRLEPLEGKRQVSDSQIRELLMKSDISEKGKVAFIGNMLGTEMETESGNPSQYAKFLSAMETGMDVDEYLQFRNDGGDVGKYLDLREAEVGKQQAIELAVDLEELEPLEGEDKVIAVQQWQAAVGSSPDPKAQLAALSSMMQEGQYKKAETAYSYGIKPATYVHLAAIKADFDEDENGSYSQKEIKAAIDALDAGYENPLLALKGELVTLTIKQKAVLWQLLTGAETAKNNPYSVEYGQMVLDTKEN